MARPVLAGSTSLEFAWERVWCYGVMLGKRQSRVEAALTWSPIKDWAASLDGEGAWKRNIGYAEALSSINGASPGGQPEWSRQLRNTFQMIRELYTIAGSESCRVVSVLKVAYLEGMLYGGGRTRAALNRGNIQRELFYDQIRGKMHVLRYFINTEPPFTDANLQQLNRILDRLSPGNDESSKMN